MRHWILLPFLFIGIILACDDDETLYPSDIKEYELIIPQGDHDYDDRIVDWFNRIGVYILYEFSPEDVYFNVSSEWAELRNDTVITEMLVAYTPISDDTFSINGEVYKFEESYSQVGGGWIVYEYYDAANVLKKQYTIDYVGQFLVKEADETYVGQQLELLERIFLNFYENDVLQKRMPLKVLLGKELQEFNVSKHWRSCFNSLIISHGDFTINNLTEEELKTLKFDLNTWFLTNMTYDLSLDEFGAVTSSCWTTGVRPALDECYGLGLVKDPRLGTYNVSSDLINYREMIISNSYETLTMEPESGNYDANDFTGILHPKKDVNGLIRQKYDLLIAEYAKLGVDLQGIGNASVLK